MSNSTAFQLLSSFLEYMQQVLMDSVARILGGWPVSALIPGKDEFVSQSTFQTTGEGIGTFDNFVYFS